MRLHPKKRTQQVGGSNDACIYIKENLFIGNVVRCVKVIGMYVLFSVLFGPEQ